MSDFNDELYFQRKFMYRDRLNHMLSEVDGNSQEDMDAFFNALEDFYYDR